MLGFKFRKFQSSSKKLENLVLDKFHEEISSENSVPTIITKRSIIPFLAARYDPLGLSNQLIGKKCYSRIFGLKYVTGTMS